jgi:drug/metabolite transporter (DMT)-like permease
LTRAVDRLDRPAAKVGLFLFLALILGASYPLIKVGLREFDPLTLVLVRLTIGAAFIATWMWLRGHRWPRGSAVLLLLVAVGVLNTVGGFVLVTWGQKYVSAAYTSILAGSNPIFAAALAALVLHDERLTLPRVIGLAVGFAGVVALFANQLGFAGAAHGSHSLLGALAVLAGAVSLAIVAVLVRSRVPTLTPAEIALPLLLTGIATVGLVIAIASVAGDSQLRFGTPRPAPVAAAVLLGVVNAGLGNLVYYALIRSVGVTRTALVGYLVPLIGVTLGVLTLGEHVDASMVAGLCLITGSLAFVSRFSGGARMAPVGGGAASTVSTRR